jgi:hypothetical protein
VAGATSPYGSLVSQFQKVGVRPALGRPDAPASVRAHRALVVSGSLKPRFKAGDKTVTVKVYRYRSGGWRYVAALKATNVDSGSFSRYRVRTGFNTRGKYRFKATATPTGWNTATTSYSTTLVVK